MEYNERQFNVLMSTCSSVGHHGGEDIAQEHVLIYRISGESHTFIGDNKYVSQPGTIALVRRNTLLKMIKYPEPDGRPFQSIAIFFDRATLKKICGGEHMDSVMPYTGDAAVDLSHNQFLKGYFDSLLPFFNAGVPLTEELAELKTREAITLLLQFNPRLRNMLFDFNEPGKIDLEAFMKKNYIFHISIPQFARLTGRSLSTFKRDFKRIFKAAPEQWITSKRLERAHFLISEQKKAPVTVYSEIGFESLSHFSTAFKKQYGYNPSSLT